MMRTIDNGRAVQGWFLGVVRAAKGAEMRGFYSKKDQKGAKIVDRGGWLWHNGGISLRCSVPSKHWSILE